MLKIKAPLRDAQQEAPAGYCEKCGAELYGEERVLCSECEVDGHE